MAQKSSVPKGTRDFSPEEMVRRNYIFNTIKTVFQNYGYLPIETPAMEHLSTLMGKYGEEGDRLLFKVLNSGDFLKNLDQNDIESKNLSQIATVIAEKGLRYDLTVPFARYVVQHLNEITFPFKRYQIQPVWRADRPQKGRYREFYQCDVDVIGSNSLLNEVELIRMIDDIFSVLGIDVTIKLNNRKILSGIAEIIGAPDKMIDITIAIDKIEKIGFDLVIEELKSKEISHEAIEKLKPILQLKGMLKEKFPKLQEILHDSETGMKGLEETMTVMRYLKDLELKAKWQLDLTLARGLEYYTGMIIEVVSNKVQMGSVCGGGRYDDLTGIFGLPNVSGVGVSFGADRIYDVLNELERFPDEVTHTTDLMLVNFGDHEAAFSLSILKKLHQSGIKAELYPDAAKMKKQMKYANQKGIKYVMLIGEEEMKSGIYSLKDMEKGNQVKGNLEEIISLIKA
ncbi:MAG: histidine--tRNA ligase [Bacteroidales bacterium]|jgi:histidyl-tRNA synthetase|nr:histidine--tRNA ligase [Bacteroidales bacterium]